MRPQPRLQSAVHIRVVWIQLQQTVILQFTFPCVRLFPLLLAVEQVVEGKSDADPLVFCQVSCHPAHGVYFRLGRGNPFSQVVLDAEQLDARLEVKVNRALSLSGSNAHIALAGHEALRGGAIVQLRRHIVEVLHTDITAQSQVHAGEVVPVVDGCIAPEETAFPLLSFIESRHLATHSVETAHKAQPVLVRQTAQVAQTDIRIVAVAVSRPHIAARRSGLHLLAGNGRNGRSLPYTQRAQGSGIIDMRFRHLRFLHLRQHVYLKSIHHLRMVLVFHHHRPVQRGILVCLLRHGRYQRQHCGRG